MKCNNLLILFVVLFSVTFGCRRFEEEKIVAKAEPFIPKNLYPIERLPAYFNRVVVLPCYYADEDSPVLDYVDEVFHQELSQERIFETLRLSSGHKLEERGSDLQEAQVTNELVLLLAAAEFG